MQVTHRGKELTWQKQANQASSTKSWSLVVSAGIQVGVGLSPGSCSGSMCLVEWKSSRAASVTHGTTKLEAGCSELWVLIDHQGWEYISVQTDSLSKCPDLWFWAFWGPLKGIPIIRHYLNLDIAFHITVMADNDAIMDCQRYPKIPLCSCSIQQATGSHIPGL